MKKIIIAIVVIILLVLGYSYLTPSKKPAPANVSSVAPDSTEMIDQNLAAVSVGAGMDEDFNSISQSIDTL